MMIVLSDKSFVRFKELTDEHKEELKPVFKIVAEELRQIIEWYREKEST